MAKVNKVYWWVSVAGANCEPAIVIDNKQAFTIGCSDPFNIEDEKCPLKLIEKCDDAVGIPLSPKQEKNERRKQLRRLNEQPHGYRKF